MRMSKPIKILLGLLTAWTSLLPLIFIAVWFSTMLLMIGSVEYLTAPENLVVPVIFFPTVILIMCSSFLQIGLTAFYLAHVILNKTGNDILRVVLGIFVFIFPYIAMPVYFFIYILPEYPPQWALSVSSEQKVVINPS